MRRGVNAEGYLNGDGLLPTRDIQLKVCWLLAQINVDGKLLHHEIYLSKRETFTNHLKQKKLCAFDYYNFLASRSLKLNVCPA